MDSQIATTRSQYFCKVDKKTMELHSVDLCTESDFRSLKFPSNYFVTVLTAFPYKCTQYMLKQRYQETSTMQWHTEARSCTGSRLVFGFTCRVYVVESKRPASSLIQVMVFYSYYFRTKRFLHRTSKIIVKILLFYKSEI